MNIKGIKDEVFNDYNKISMLIICPKCTVRCYAEHNLPPEICQNNHLHKTLTYNIDNQKIIERYLSNPLTEAVIFGGLDSWDSVEEILIFINDFRKVCNDDIVLYTGRYITEDIVQKHLHKFNGLSNVYIKFGRYIPSLKPIVDKLTNVTLASSNQYFYKV
jgi:hypothetical protein